MTEATELNVYAGDAAPILVEVTRGGMVECTHRGIAAVTDSDGKIVHSWGDVSRLTFARSAIKPLQALPVFESGAADAFGLANHEVSLCCASHSGEPMHVDTVVAWLERLGLGVDDLECGPQLPVREVSAHALIKAGIEPTKAHNNCSGKHSGMLTTAVHLGEPTKGYSSDDHPVQKRLRALIEEMSGDDLSGVPTGYDGCGIPIFGVSIKGLATAMARFADPSNQSTERQAAIKRIVECCAEHPLMIAGTGRFNSAVLTETGTKCLLKGGAEGVYMAALPDLGLGVALKIDDGSSRGSERAMGAILKKLGIIDEAMEATLADQLKAPVRNWAGRLVGEVRPAGSAAF